MNELGRLNNNLPSILEDLSKFVLVGREKLNSVRAEIRAIDKLSLAEEVREQKRQEAQMLAEALIDAEVRIGDLLKEIPKANGKRTDLEPIDSSVGKLKTKRQIVEELGFNQKQAERFETLSNNKDIVEQVKAEARENEDIPTRTRVLELVKQKNQKTDLEDEYIKKQYQEIERETQISLRLDKAVYGLLTLEFNDETLEIWIENMDEYHKEKLETDLADLIEEVEKIRVFYKKYKSLRRVK